MKIGLFIPCYVDAVFPEVGIATYKLLRHLGLDVEYPEGQTCCGQPMANAGFESQAIPLAAKFEDICIDTGLSSEVLKEKVSLGDKVVLKPYFGEMLGGNVTGTAIDDRAGMAILAKTMELLKKNGATSKITAVFSVGEEVGGKGAGNASFYTEAEEAIAVDVSFASQPEVDGAHKNATMPLGGGAFIG